jgi:hypothetical protein
MPSLSNSSFSALSFPNCHIALLDGAFTISAPPFASGPARCHGAAMSRQRPRRAGGALLALAIVGGAIAGVFAGESSIGVVGGAALGLVLMLGVWFLDRRR